MFEYNMGTSERPTEAVSRRTGGPGGGLQQDTPLGLLLGIPPVGFGALAERLVPCCRAVAEGLRRFSPWASKFSDAMEAWASRWTPELIALQRVTRKLERAAAAWREAYLQALNRPEGVQLARGILGFLSLLESAPEYCAPYNRELDKLGLPPLSGEEEQRFVSAAFLLQGGYEWSLCSPAPLAQVALLAERPDISAALIMKRKAARRAVRSLQMTNPGLRDDLVGEAYVGLRNRILPNIRRPMDGIPLSEMRTVLAPRLKEVTGDAYLTVSIRRDLVDYLKAQGKKDGLEVPQDLSPLADPMPPPGSDDLPQRLDIEEALRAFLRLPRATGLDRKMVAVFREDPQLSARSIASWIEEPVRTVQVHYREMMEFVKKRVQV